MQRFRRLFDRIERRSIHCPHMFKWLTKMTFAFDAYPEAQAYRKHGRLGSLKIVSGFCGSVHNMD